MGSSAIIPSARPPASSFTAPPVLLVLFSGPLVLPVVHRLRATGHRDNDFVQLRIGAFSVAFACMVLLVASLHLPSLPPQSLLWLLACFVLLVLGELVIAPLGFALMTRIVAPASASSTPCGTPPWQPTLSLRERSARCCSKKPKWLGFAVLTAYR